MQSNEYVRNLCASFVTGTAFIELHVLRNNFHVYIFNCP